MSVNWFIGDTGLDQMAMTAEHILALGDAGSKTTATSQQLFTDPAAEGLGSERLLGLMRLLQSSLRLPDLISLFAREVQRELDHAGLSYVGIAGVDGAGRDAAEQTRYAVTLGREAPHRLSYRLEILDHPLGELTLMGDTPFTLRQIEHFEALLAALLYPLRNAILYERALNSALKDPLTGLSNREAMESYLRREMAAARRHGTALALLLIDVDRFKSINDGYGHLVGDTVLSEVARTLLHCCRDSDIVFRYGGEEFVVVLASTDLSGAERVAERIRAAVEALDIDSAGQHLGVTVSAGVTTLGIDDDRTSLLARSDRLLYEAKAEGRNRVVSG